VRLALQVLLEVRVRELSKQLLFFFVLLGVPPELNADIPLGWSCEYTVGSPIIIDVRSDCRPKCDSKPATKRFSIGGVKCTADDATIAFAMVGCLVHAKGVLSAQDCGNTKGQVTLVKPSEIGNQVLTDKKTASHDKWKCVYTVNSPRVITLHDICEKGCDKQSPRKLAAGSLKCESDGLQPKYQMAVCRFDEKDVLGPNDCRLEKMDKGENSVRVQTMEEAKLNLLKTGALGE